MKIILSGGGTGGHIYPALTIIKTLKELQPEAEFLYVGTSKGLEADIVPRENIPFATLDIAGFKRSLTPANFKIFGKAMKAVFKAKKIIDDFKPDVVVGTGGYVCGPILLAAALKGIPTLIQEQNAIPGITNKILGKFVDKIAVGYEGAKPYFPPKKTICTGNPIRPEFFQVEDVEKKIGKKLVLVSGGSRGAHTINQSMLAVHKHFYHHPQVEIIHATGQLEYDYVINGLKKQGIELQPGDNLKVQPYLYNMPELIQQADLCVFRAGASSLAELTAMGAPAILVPYPYAAANHQEKNAMELAEAGAAKVILNRHLNGEVLIKALEELLGDEQGLQRMAAASKSLGKPAAAEHIAQLILQELKNK